MRLKLLGGWVWGHRQPQQQQTVRSSSLVFMRWGVSECPSSIYLPFFICFAMGCSSKFNFDKIARIQDQAPRTIPGDAATRSSVKLQSFKGGPIIQSTRIPEPITCRLKRKRNPQTRKVRLRPLPTTNKNISSYTNLLPWKRDRFPVTRNNTLGIFKKGTQSGVERKAITQEYIQQAYPHERQTQVYTDRAAGEATRSGGREWRSRNPA